MSTTHVCIGALIAHHKRDKLIGAICASPAVILLHMKSLNLKNATCHPSFRDSMPNDIFVNENVVQDGRVITSQGPGTAMAFSLALVAELHSEEVAQQLAESMVCHL